MVTIDDANNLNNEENSSQYNGERELELAKKETDKAMERFNTVMLATEDGIWDWDIVTSEVYFSPAWQTMLGYEVGEIEQNMEAWISILHPDDLEPTIAHAQKFIKNESSEYKMEFRMLCKDGSYKWVLARAKDAERDEKGDVTRIIGTHVDIQERKTHERELELAKKETDKAMERFNMVMLATEDGIWDWDIVTSEVYFSPAWQTMLGYEVGEIEQNMEAWISILHPDDLEPTIAHAQKFIKNESSEYKMEFRMLCKDGSYKWVLARAKDAERNEKGDVTRIIGTHVDIQERKTHERELIKANEYAETRIIEEIKKNKEKEKVLFQQSKLAAMGDMIGNIAHQWRQPLSAISTGATGMKLQKEYGILSDEIFNNTCDAIDRNAQYLSKTIDDFRNFIKGDRNKKIFSLTNEINSFLLLVDGTIKSNDISIILELENDIKINGYANELIQCLINIFNNAKDALREETIEKKLVFISTATQSNNVIIKIKDNAGGVPVNVLPRIFEPYFTTKHQSQGTGLGLHMTYNLIVDGMNGTIKSNNVSYKYEETDYVGAEFTIVLPLT